MSGDLRKLWPEKPALMLNKRYNPGFECDRGYRSPFARSIISLDFPECPEVGSVYLAHRHQHRISEVKQRLQCQCGVPHDYWEKTGEGTGAKPFHGGIIGTATYLDKNDHSVCLAVDLPFARCGKARTFTQLVMDLRAGADLDTAVDLCVSVGRCNVAGLSE